MKGVAIHPCSMPREEWKWREIKNMHFHDPFVVNNESEEILRI